MDGKPLVLLHLMNHEVVAAVFSKTLAGESPDETSAIHINEVTLVNVTVGVEHTLRVEHLCSDRVKS